MRGPPVVPEQFIRSVSDRFGKNTDIYQQLDAIAPHVLFRSHGILRISPSSSISDSTRVNHNFPNISLQIKTTDSESIYKVNALLDSGATGLYIDKGFVDKHGLTTHELQQPLRVYNADGSHNSNGVITHEVQLQFTVQGHTSKNWFYVTDLAGKAIIVGMNWLRDHNPVIDWQTGKITFNRCPSSCGGQTLIPQNLNKLIDESTELSEDELINREIRHQILLVQTESTRLATEAWKKQEHLSLDDILKGPYNDFVDVFSEEGFQAVPGRRKWDHAIDLQPDWQDKTWKSRIYPLPPSQQKELDEFLEENLANGRIRSSKSPLASPFFFVSKKGGQLRPIVDYRKLNDITVKNKTPLPLVTELVDKWKYCKYFTKLDVRAGYFNIRIKEGDEWKTAFVTNRGLYESNVMNFGLVNAPATFQTMMNDIFVDYVRRGDTGVYIDDVIIGTKSDPTGKLSDLEYHEKAVREILEVFREQKLFLKPEKCDFSQKQVEYLGFVISGDHVMMDPTKVEGVTTWPVPTSLKQLRSFLGFCNFYRRFVQNYSELARPLHDLQKKDAPWSWKEEQQNAFDQIKKVITSSPILVHPDPSKPFMVECDASDYAIGAVLSQKQSDDKWHPIAFYSHAMTKEERNYKIHDKELLAIVESLKEWKHFLRGTIETVEVLTDHANLRYFRTAQDLNRRQARWALFLEEFNIHLVHRPGRLSGKPDALSRRADHDDGSEDNKQQVLLPEEIFHKINFIEIRSKFDLGIHEAQLKDPLIQDLQKRREGDHPKGWNWDEGIWKYQGKIYVPEHLRREVFDSHHSSPAAGHPGIKPSLEAIAKYYYWPNIRQDVESRVKNCDTCQRIKTFPTKPVGQLHPTQIPSSPWEIVSMDLITGLPESAGYDSLLVVVDRFSKMVVIVACNSTLDSLGLARLLRDHVWSRFGIPRVIISDRGPQFASNFTKDLAKLLGVQLAISTAYHPQSDGQSERMNQEIEKYLRAYVGYHQNDWTEWIASCQFAMNNTVKSSTGFTPFELNYGRHPNPGSAPQAIHTDVPAVEDFVKGLHKSHESAKKALEKAAESMKKFADKKRGPNPDFKIGDLVMLSSANLSVDQPSRKLSSKWEGPFKIVAKVSNLNYKLELPDSWRIHDTFHVDKLRPYHQDPSSPNHPKPPPDLVKGEEEYEVENILDCQYRRGILNYKVSWKGYSPSEASWIRADNADNMKDIVDAWHSLYPDAPRSLRPVKPTPKTGGRPLRKIRVIGLGPFNIQTEGIALDFQPLDPVTNVESWPDGPLTRDVST